MANISIDCESFRCPKGYRLTNRWALNPGEEAQIDNVEVVASNGPERTPYRPLDRPGSGDLYLLFANVMNADDLLRFIERWGPLMTDAANWGDPVPPLLREANFFRRLLAHKDRAKKLASVFTSEMRAREIRAYKRAGDTAPHSIDESNLFRMVGRIDLVADPSKGVRLRIGTHCLIGALWWQLGQKLSGNASFAECRQCGEWFETGPGTGRHVDANFCCNEHKVTFFSHARSRRSRAGTSGG
jgi:hypothetical protein